jgi:hypothetical protein
MKRSLLNQALRIAKDKLSTHPELDNFPHYSFIVQAGKIIEWATNGAHEPPIHYGYHNRQKDDGFKPKYHSETWAYKRARGILEDGSFEIVNIRLNKKGEIRLARPCKPCYDLLTILGCRRYYYSSEVGFLLLTGL